MGLQKNGIAERVNYDIVHFAEKFVNIPVFVLIILLADVILDILHLND